MRCVRPFILLAALVAALALAAAPAIAESPVTRDCYANHGERLNHRYTIHQLRVALATMPADIKEYTNCGQVIEDQLLRQLGTAVPGAKADSGASDGSVISTPLLVILIVVIVGGGGLAYLAWRRGRGGTPPTPGGG